MPSPAAIRAFAPAADPRTDGELVARFAADRDPTAAAELVRRHAGLVLAVCRRHVADRHLADDAFQAVWLVFARRTAAVRPPGAVAGWLYGVAVRTARKARAMAAKRRSRETPTDAPERPVADARPDPDLRPLVDAELAALPDKYRAVLVLCDLHDTPRPRPAGGGPAASAGPAVGRATPAARALGWPEGTVAGRLRKARALLAARLTRRGVTLAAAAVGPALAADAAVAAPPPLVAAAADAVAATAAGVAPAVSPTALLLAERTVRAMIARTWAFWTAAGLAAVAAVGGAVAVGGGRPAAAPIPKGAAVAWAEQPEIRTPGWLPGSLAFTPDRATMVVGGTGGRVRGYDAPTGKVRWEATVGDGFAGVAVAADGRTAGATFADGVRLLDPDTGRIDATIEEKGSAPTAVAFFADQPAAPGVPLRRVAFGNTGGYKVKSWLEWPKLSTSTLAIDPADRRAVPLAAAPAGAEVRAVMTGPLDRRTGRNALWAWGAGSGAPAVELTGHAAAATAAAWSAAGGTVVTADAAGVVIVRDGKTFRETARLDLGGRVAGVAVTADGGRVAAAAVQPQERKGADSYREAVYVWETASPPAKPQPLGTRQASGRFDGVGSVAFSPTGRTLAAAFADFTRPESELPPDGRVRLWRLTALPPAAPGERPGG
jgi:RNA polymerase sigma factor (sigma-70 family)